MPKDWLSGKGCINLTLWQRLCDFGSVTKVFVALSRWQRLNDWVNGNSGFRNQGPEEISSHLLLEHKTNCCVRSKIINFLVGPQEFLLATVKMKKKKERKKENMIWACHTPLQLPKTILQGTLEGGRRRDLERKCCMDNIKEWISPPLPQLLTISSCRSVKSSRRPNRSRDWSELNWTELDGNIGYMTGPKAKVIWLT